MTDEQMKKAGEIGIILNTSISPLDFGNEIAERLKEYERYKKYGISVLRIVSCKFNPRNKNGKDYQNVQETLFKNKNIIDNPMRISPSHPLVTDGIIFIEKRKDLNREIYISVANPKTSYTGHCSKCPELCGLIYGD